MPVSPGTELGDDCHMPCHLMEAGCVFSETYHRDRGRKRRRYASAGIPMSIIAWSGCCTPKTPITMVDGFEDLVSHPRNHAAWREPLPSAAVMKLGGAVGRAAAGKSPTARIPSARLHRRAGVSVARRRAWNRQSTMAGGSFPVGTTGELRAPRCLVAAVPVVEHSARGQVCRRRGVRPLPPRHCRDVPPPSDGTIARSDRLRAAGRFRWTDRNEDVRRRSLRVHDRTARRT